MTNEIIRLGQQKSDELLVIEPESSTRTARPPLYKVVLLNDDYTPIDFVVGVLKQFFHKGHEEAIRITLDVHNRGSGTCGVFTRDVAETKIDLVTLAARKNEHPLQCVMEKE